MRGFEIMEQISPFFYNDVTSILPSQTLTLTHSFPSPFFDLSFETTPFDPLYDTVTDLVQIETTPFSSVYKRQQQRQRRVDKGALYLQTLCDRVAALESKFDRLVNREVDRKYTWTAEIKDGRAERKYKWAAEIKGEGEKSKNQKKKGKEGGGVGERNYKWTAEIKGKDDEKRTYTWKAMIGGEKVEEKKVKEKKEKKECSGTRIVEIEEPSDQRVVVLRQAFAKRTGAAASKGKRKELSPQDAAIMIQMTFRAYLIRRSQALRALRDLAVAKTKLKEIRTLFNNFSYRSRIARDAEERQKFSEKIIVLLLTVDAIEGVDLMVRAAKRSMVDELEAMLDVVDPQPTGRSLSMRRRAFDMPSGSISKEIAEGVAQVVQMLDEEDKASE